jgi:hypothetical protein
MKLATMDVMTYAPSVHGGTRSTGGYGVELDTGAVWEYLGRGWHCACGEILRDGDPIIERVRDRAMAHENCAHLIGVGG